MEQNLSIFIILGTFNYISLRSPGFITSRESKKNIRMVVMQNTLILIIIIITIMDFCHQVSISLE